MPAIFEQQWLILASLSRAWPAPTTLNLMAVTPERGNQADSGGYFLRTALQASSFLYWIRQNKID